MDVPRHPVLYEINTLPFVRAEKMANLDEVSEAWWSDLAERGIDWVWLMGVWERSPRGRRIALADPNLRRAYDEILPGWREEDVAGSPYAVHGYRLDPGLGEPAALARVRDRIHGAGMRLLLDFVPNHLALDHPWTKAHPQRFVHRAPAEGEDPPDGWFLPDGGSRWIAHGRDPYFPPWTDTAQVNFFATELRWAHIGELLRIAETADGVRCDMAMLGLNEVFARIWGNEVEEETPAREFWQEAIDMVKARYPGFLFLAEAYWGTEQTLLDLGFDYVYDKGLYDRLRHGGARDVREHLTQHAAGKARAAHFIENHDEEPALHAFGGERSRAAAVVCATLPGMRFFHQGQLEGRATRVPVQLGRAPEEPRNVPLASFYRELLTTLRLPVFRQGEWRLLDVERAGDETNKHLLAWRWRWGEETALVVVNFSSGAARGRLVVDDGPRSSPPVEVQPEWRALLPAEGAEPCRLRTRQLLEMELPAWGNQIFVAMPGIG